MAEQFDASEMMAAARAATGLDDFGKPDVREPLEVLVQSLNRDAPLSEKGAKAFRNRLHMHLCNRLTMAADLARYPAIADEKIDAPLIVTGLPRSGSSYLLELLAQDPARRSLATWQMFAPSPPPALDPDSASDRVARVDRLLEEQGFANADVQATHPFGATAIDECAFVIEQSLISGNLAAFAAASGYEAWLATPAADPAKYYAFHRRFLQHLQYGGADSNWVLKAPAHMFALGALLAEYPDAQIVMTHRDVAEALPSLASMAAALNRIFCEAESIDEKAIGALITERIAAGLDFALATRDNLNRQEQFHDVTYARLRQDPLGEVERIYDRFALQLSDEAREAMSRFANEKGRQKHAHGGHRYTAAQFGMTADSLRRRFAGYMERFDIPEGAPR